MRIVWRPEGSASWIAGTSINASRTGLLIETDYEPDLETSLELVLPFSWELAPHLRDAADVLCSGHVVRIERRDLPEAAIRFGVAIDRYVFLPHDDSSSRGGADA